MTLFRNPGSLAGASICLAMFFSAQALASGGKTADGCTYRIINGQYLTSCDSSASGAPVDSYDSVPLRAGSVEASPPAVVSAPPLVELKEAPPVFSPAPGSPENVITQRKQTTRSAMALTETFIGAQAGSTSIKDGGSGTGIGLTLGTLLNENFGFEFGYSFTQQDIDLGLASRAELNPVYTRASSDASLKAHLLSGEFQGYLTEPERKLRPFFGLGLGWKSSQLREKFSEYDSYDSVPGSLDQTSFGGLGSAGAKFRVGKAVHLGLSFRYFFPLARQNSRLKQVITAAPSEEASTQGSSTGRLTKADDALTGASQTQIFGGLQYAF